MPHFVLAGSTAYGFRPPSNGTPDIGFVDDCFGVELNPGNREFRSLAFVDFMAREYLDPEHRFITAMTDDVADKLADPLLLSRACERTPGNGMIERFPTALAIAFEVECIPLSDYELLDDLPHEPLRRDMEERLVPAFRIGWMREV